MTTFRRVPIVHCPQCNELFEIPGQRTGFTNCADHRVWTPLPAFKKRGLRLGDVTYFDVSCSNCGNGFHIPDGRNGGFSHCDQHVEYGPGDDW